MNDLEDTVGGGFSVIGDAELTRTASVNCSTLQSQLLLGTQCVGVERATVVQRTRVTAGELRATCVQGTTLGGCVGEDVVVGLRRGNHHMAVDDGGGECRTENVLCVKHLE